MSNSHDNRLDRLLNDWSDTTAASAEELSDLGRKIVEQLDNDSVVLTPLPPPFTATRRFLMVSLVTAAGLLIALGAWRWLRPTDNQPQLAMNNAFDSAGSFEADWPKQLRRQERLLAEYRDLFGQDVAWVTETEQSCDVGLAAADTSDRPSEYVVVQLWLVARNQRDSQTKVHTISVLAGREEVVDLPASAGGGQLVLWAHPVDEEMISIDLRYQPASVAGVEIDGSNLQRVGQVTNIHSFEQDGVEYRLYQTAGLLADADLG